jgi:hypothetical protein
VFAGIGLLCETHKLRKYVSRSSWRSLDVTWKSVTSRPYLYMRTFADDLVWRVLTPPMSGTRTVDVAGDRTGLAMWFEGPKQPQLVLADPVRSVHSESRVLDRSIAAVMR